MGNTTPRAGTFASTIITQPSGTSTPGTLPPLPGYTQWVSRLQAATNQIASLDQSAYTRLQLVQGQLGKPSLALTFGGHFSSGKSTLINAALGLSLLPVDDFPETGAICMLRQGDQNSAEVVAGAQRRAIECTTAAIQREVSLISQTGERKVQVRKIDQLSITLKNARIPPRVTWIDSPGIDDTVEMNERALQAARQGDLLLWVLDSRQMLSETDMAFLAQYMAESGTNSIVFLLNAFLPEDSAEQWNAFLDRPLRVYQNKINDHASLMGFKQGVHPAVIVVSGRAISAGKAGFGGTELRALMEALTTSEHPCVQRARLFRAVKILRQILAEAQQKLSAERASLESARAALERQRQEAARKETLFKNAVQDAVRTALAEWASAARAAGESVSSSITLQTLRSGDYTGKLTQALQSAAGDAVDSLLSEVATLTRYHDRTSLSYSTGLRDLLTPSEAYVAIADNKVGGGGALAGAAAGAAVGSFIPVVGTIVGGIFGAIVGAGAEANSAVNRDVQDTKANVSRATENAISELQRKQQEAVNYIVSHTSLNTQFISQPDESIVRRGETVVQLLTGLITQADQLQAA